MATTEKVSISSTALSILFYECLNSSNSQEGFFLGEVTTELINHISDSQNDTARLDTRIVVNNILPLPSVSMFYLPTGDIKEDVIKDFLGNKINEVVGWYKYRKNTCINPTFRDKQISRGLQRYFEKHHCKKHFTCCNLTKRIICNGATYILSYRFGKINCFDMYEPIDEVISNLGQKLTGYKRYCRPVEGTVYANVIEESNIHNNPSSDVILRVQEVINKKLQYEAKIAAKNEGTIRELEAEIKQMSDFLADRQAIDLQQANDKFIEEKLNLLNRDTEMAEVYAAAMKSSSSMDIFTLPNILLNSHKISDYNNSASNVQKNTIRSLSPSLPSTSTGKLTTNNCISTQFDKPSTSTSNCADLITFDVEESQTQEPVIFNNDNSVGDSSPDY